MESWWSLGLLLEFPGSMMKNLLEVLVKRGLDSRRLAFGLYSDKILLKMNLDRIKNEEGNMLCV
jgi:hypothetical protein